MTEMPPGYQLCPVCKARAYRGSNPSCDSAQCVAQVSTVREGELEQKRARESSAQPRNAVVRNGRKSASRPSAPGTERAKVVSAPEPPVFATEPSTTPSARAVPVATPPPAARPASRPAANDPLGGAAPEARPGPVRFVVPGRAVPKERPRVVSREDSSGQRTTRAFTPTRTSDYEQKVRDVARLYVRRPLECRLSVRLVIFARGQVADVDNLAKAVLDGCQHAAFVDDNQVDHLEVTRVAEFEGDEQVRVTIEPFTSAALAS